MRGNASERTRDDGSVSLRHVTDAYGRTSAVYAVGVPAWQSQSDADPYKGSGARFSYYADKETGLYLCTYRYYDPQNARWLNRDPIGYDGGLNVYAYTNGDPVNGIDPLGLQTSNPFCDSLLRKIVNKRMKLEERMKKYDPEGDFLGGHDNGFGGTTKPFAHYVLILRDQAELMDDIKQFNDRCGGRGGFRVQRELTWRERRVPVSPRPNYPAWKPRFTSHPDAPVLPVIIEPPLRDVTLETMIWFVPLAKAPQALRAGLGAAGAGWNAAVKAASSINWGPVPAMP